MHKRWPSPEIAVKLLKRGQSVIHSGFHLLLNLQTIDDVQHGQKIRNGRSTTESRLSFGMSMIAHKRALKSFQQLLIKLTFACGHRVCRYTWKLWSFQRVCESYYEMTNRFSKRLLDIAKVTVDASTGLILFLTNFLSIHIAERRINHERVCGYWREVQKPYWVKQTSYFGNEK